MTQNRMNAELEQQLVVGCRQGDRDAQRRLYDLTSEKIHRLMLRMTRSPDDAFDLTQEAYMRAFSQIDQFDGRSSLGTWLYRIAVNQALQFLRRAKLGQQKMQVVRERHVPETGLDARDTRIDVRAALGTLDADERAILLLRYHEGLSYQEIADVLGCAEGTVASRLSRGRQKLKDRLSESYGLGEGTEPAGHLSHVAGETVADRRQSGAQPDELQW